MEDNPTLFTERKEAEIGVYGRLVAMRAAQAIARSPSKLQDATRIEMLDGDGKATFETELADLTPFFVPLLFSDCSPTTANLFCP